jgi:hypothetical protein
MESGEIVGKVSLQWCTQYRFFSQAMAMSSECWNLFVDRMCKKRTWHSIKKQLSNCRQNYIEKCKLTERMSCISFWPNQTKYNNMSSDKLVSVTHKVLDHHLHAVVSVRSYLLTNAWVIEKRDPLTSPTFPTRTNTILKVIGILYYDGSPN